MGEYATILRGTIVMAYRHLPVVLGALMVFGVAVAAPDFELEDLDGVQHRLSDYRGTWVIVNYWATWCPPCIDEMPALMDFYETHREDGVAVLGVNIEEIDVMELRHFVDSLLVGYPILLSGAHPPESMPAVFGLPTTFVVSPEGDIVATSIGPVTGADLEASIREHGGFVEPGE